jgi:hypothetical protein
MVDAAVLVTPEPPSWFLHSPSPRTWLSGGGPIGTLGYRKGREDALEDPVARETLRRALALLTVEALDETAADVPAVRRLAELPLEWFVKTD